MTTPQARKEQKAKKRPATKRVVAIKPSGQDKGVGEKWVEIYSLLDPRDGSIRYVGKANDSLKRLKTHLAETRRSTPLYCWIEKLRGLGLVPQLQVMSVCNFSDWQQCEREAIANARLRGLNILNLADGGDEPYCPPEVRAANGRANAIARVSTSQKARAYKSNHMLGILLRQGHVSESAKEKMRYAAAKRPDLFGRWAAI